MCSLCLQLVTTRPILEPPEDATCYMQLFSSCLVLKNESCEVKSLVYEPLRGNKILLMDINRSALLLQV